MKPDPRWAPEQLEVFRRARTGDAAAAAEMRAMVDAAGVVIEPFKPLAD